MLLFEELHSLMLQSTAPRRDSGWLPSWVYAGTLLPTIRARCAPASADTPPTCLPRIDTLPQYPRAIQRNKMEG
uniref:Uncharacterized protein n=1 Tax=Parascaris equorum TaxID=6256 RepID=A0A914RQM0_PAREQ